MKRRLLLIGGGHSHVEVIRRWGLAPEPDVTVTLVSPDRHTPYSGMLPGFIAGHYVHADCHIDLERLCAAAGVRRVAATVNSLDLQARLARCEQGQDQPFDLLSIDTGSTPVTAPIPGATEHGIAIKPVAAFVERWDRLREKARHAQHPLHIAVVGAGAAGVEVILAMQHRIAADGGRAHFTLIGNEPVILGVHPHGVQRRFERTLHERGISLLTGTAVSRAEAGVLVLNGSERLPCDETVWITGAAAPAWPRENGLRTDGAGFILVDRHLQSLSHPEIFAAGDVATMAETPHPKSGVYAVRHGPVLAENLCRALRGEPLTVYSPQTISLALISAGNRHAVASYGPFAFGGDWVWRWKDRIDRQFMRRYDAISDPSGENK